MTNGAERMRRNIIRSWDTHEVHGEPGFVTCKHSTVLMLLDQLESAEATRDAVIHQGHLSAAHWLEREADLLAAANAAPMHAPVSPAGWWSFTALLCVLVAAAACAVTSQLAGHDQYLAGVQEGAARPADPAPPPVFLPRELPPGVVAVSKGSLAAFPHTWTDSGPTYHIPGRLIEVVP